MKSVRLPDAKPGDIHCFGCAENRRYFGALGQKAPYNSDKDTEFWQYEYTTGWTRIFCKECMKRT